MSFWPIPATEIGHYGAVATGLVVVLWFGGFLRANLSVLVAGAALLLSHTRTALIAMVAGILVACLSLFAAKDRVRNFFAAATVIVTIGAVTAASVVTTWLARGEQAQELSSLTGRTNFWAMVLQEPRTSSRRSSVSASRMPPSTAFPSTATGLPHKWNKVCSA